MAVQMIRAINVNEFDHQLDIYVTKGVDEAAALSAIGQYGRAHTHWDGGGLVILYVDKARSLEVTKRCLLDIRVEGDTDVDSIAKFTVDAMKAPSIQQFWTDNQDRLKKLGWARSGWDY